MKFTRAVGKVVKPFVNFPAWLGWKQIAVTGRQIYSLAKDLTQKNKKEAMLQETFAQAMQRLNLTDVDVAKNCRTHLNLAIFYLICAVALFIYTIYLFGWHDYLIAPVVSLVLTILMLAFAYREHFWYFQMKKHKLGCSFKEWKAFILNRGDKK